MASRKMRLQVTFAAMPEGEVMAALRVADPGDYPYPEIFPEDESGWPWEDDGGWDFERGEEVVTRKVFASSLEAEKGAQEAVRRVERRLYEWRRMQKPEDYEVEV